jgi:signal transduction histidine kinase
LGKGGLNDVKLGGIKRLVLSLTGLYMLIFMAMLIARPGTDQFYKDFNNIYQILPPLFAGVCGLARARKEDPGSPHRRLGWLLVGLASLSFTLGQITWTFYETWLRIDELPSPGPPDIGYGAVAPFFVAGLLLLFGSMPTAGRVRLLMDSALAAGSVALISWYFVIAQLWQSEHISLIGKLVSVMFPIGDVAILFCALALRSASIADASLRRSIEFISWGVVSFALGDVLYSLYNLHSTYQTGSWFDWAWSFGWLLIGYGCLLPLWWPIPASATRKSRRRPSLPLSLVSSPYWAVIHLLGPYLTLAISFGFIVRHNLSDDGKVDVSVLVAGFFFMALILGRQVLALLENRELTLRQQNQEALRQANAALELRVRERTAELELSNTQLSQSNQEALVAREEAERANLAKSEFLSRMSHELRTPLNAILGFGQILEMRGVDADPLEQESVQLILAGGRHLLGLINEVLDIARVEAGGMELCIEPIQLDELVSEVFSLLRPLAAQRGIGLGQELWAPEHNHVLADHQRLRQVLLNLVSNAIKYNRPDGEVTISTSGAAEGKTRISVHDTGPGIAPDDLPKLFKPFERLNADNSDVEGTGLGLVLSHRLAMAMGGTLQVESVLEQGSTFFLELAPAVPAEQALTISSETVVDSPSLGRTGRQYSVLSIEDNLSNVRLLEAILRKRPEISLLTAMQGSIGLDLAFQHHPDLILLDVNLPDLMGTVVLERLKADPLTQDIPVIVLSADATPLQMQRLLSSGAMAYLTKPLDVGKFLSLLDETLL